MELIDEAIRAWTPELRSAADVGELSEELSRLIRQLNSLAEGEEEEVDTNLFNCRSAIEVLRPLSQRVVSVLECAK